jgi:hypothetical protein
VNHPTARLSALSKLGDITIDEANTLMADASVRCQLGLSRCHKNLFAFWFVPLEFVAASPADGYEWSHWMARERLFGAVRSRARPGGGLALIT